METAQQKKDGKEKAAKLVVIVHDMDPIDMFCWLPALCRKKEMPYCIHKVSPCRIGKLMHIKTASCVAVMRWFCIDVARHFCETRQTSLPLCHSVSSVLM